MKIAILVSMFPPKQFGGTETATQNIAKHLIEEGNEVHVLTSQDKGLAREDKKDGFFIHRVSYPKIKTFGVILFWIKLFLCLRRIDPEIVHSQSIQMAIPCFLAKKFLRKPYLVYCRGSDVYLPWRFKNTVSKLVLRNADAVIALTKDMKKKLEGVCDKEVFVISNGVELEKFVNVAKEEIGNRLQIKRTEKTILFVGGLKPVKGIQYLIKALDIIRNNNPEAKLILVGEGEERENLEKLTKELNLEKYVDFIGKVPNEKVPGHMVASDIFVLPSLSEGFPVTVLEAMASGLPIVATKVGGLSEIVKDGKNGFLIEPKNPEQIAEKVLLLLKNNELKRKISNENRNKAKRYSWEDVIRQLKKIYLKILDNKK